MTDERDPFEPDEELEDDDGDLLEPAVTVEIAGLSLYTRHGVSEAERELGQRLLIDVLVRARGLRRDRHRPDRGHGGLRRGLRAGCAGRPGALLPNTRASVRGDRGTPGRPLRRRVDPGQGRQTRAADPPPGRGGLRRGLEGEPRPVPGYGWGGPRSRSRTSSVTGWIDSGSAIWTPRVVSTTPWAGPPGGTGAPPAGSAAGRSARLPRPERTARRSAGSGAERSSPGGRPRRPERPRWAHPSASSPYRRARRQHPRRRCLHRQSPGRLP